MLLIVFVNESGLMVELHWLYIRSITQPLYFWLFKLLYLWPWRGDLLRCVWKRCHSDNLDAHNIYCLSLTSLSTCLESSGRKSWPFLKYFIYVLLTTYMEIVSLIYFSIPWKFRLNTITFPEILHIYYINNLDPHSIFWCSSSSPKYSLKISTKYH